MLANLPVAASCLLQQLDETIASVLARCPKCCLCPTAAGQRDHWQPAGQPVIFASCLLQQLDEETTASVLASLQYATECAPNWAKAWHHFALYNVECMQHYASLDVHTAQRHVAPAVMGFFRSIALSQALGEQQMFVNRMCKCCKVHASDVLRPLR